MNFLKKGRSKSLNWCQVCCYY